MSDYTNRTVKSRYATEKEPATPAPSTSRSRSSTHSAGSTGSTSSTSSLKPVLQQPAAAIWLQDTKQQPHQYQLTSPREPHIPLSPKGLQATSPKVPSSNSTKGFVPTAAHARSAVAIQRFAAALDAAGLADPVVRALAVNYTAGSGTSTAEDNEVQLSSREQGDTVADVGSGTATKVAGAARLQPNAQSSSRASSSRSSYNGTTSCGISYSRLPSQGACQAGTQFRDVSSSPSNPSTPATPATAAEAVQRFAATASKAGLATPQFMAIAVGSRMSNETGGNNKSSSSPTAQAAAKRKEALLHTGSSTASNGSKTSGHGMGYSAAGTIAPLRSNDYGTVHGRQRMSSSTGDGITGWGSYDGSSSMRAPAAAAAAAAAANMDSPWGSYRWRTGSTTNPAAISEDGSVVTSTDAHVTVISGVPPDRQYRLHSNVLPHSPTAGGGDNGSPTATAVLPDRQCTSPGTVLPVLLSNDSNGSASESPRTHSSRNPSQDSSKVNMLKNPSQRSSVSSGASRHSAAAGSARSSNTGSSRGSRNSSSSDSRESVVRSTRPRNSAGNSSSGSHKHSRLASHSSTESIGGSHTHINAAADASNRGSSGGSSSSSIPNPLSVKHASFSREHQPVPHPEAHSEQELFAVQHHDDIEEAEDTDFGEPQFWLSPVMAGSATGQQTAAGGTASADSISSPVGSIKPKRHRGGDVFSPRERSRLHSDELEVAASTRSDEYAAAAAAGVDDGSWHPEQQQISARRSAAGAAIAAAAAAFGGLKSAFGGSRSGSKALPVASAQLPVEDAPVSNCDDGTEVYCTVEDDYAPTVMQHDSHAMQQHQHQQPRGQSWMGQGSSSCGNQAEALINRSSEGSVESHGSNSDCEADQPDPTNPPSCWNFRSRSNQPSDNANNPAASSWTNCFSKSSPTNKTDKPTEPSSRSPSRRRKCCTIMLILFALVAAAGLGVGVYMGINKHKDTEPLGPFNSKLQSPSATRMRPAGGNPATNTDIITSTGSTGVTVPSAGGIQAIRPMNFQVVLAVPAVSAPAACAAWFDSPERISLYKKIFAASYTSALQQPVSESAISSINCAGFSIYNRSTTATTAAAAVAAFTAAAAKSSEQIAAATEGKAGVTPSGMRVAQPAATAAAAPQPSEQKFKADKAGPVQAAAAPKARQTAAAAASASAAQMSAGAASNATGGGVSTAVASTAPAGNNSILAAPPVVYANPSGVKHIPTAGGAPNHFKQVPTALYAAQTARQKPVYTATAPGVQVIKLIATAAPAPHSVKTVANSAAALGNAAVAAAPAQGTHSEDTVADGWHSAKRVATAAPAAQSIKQVATAAAARPQAAQLAPTAATVQAEHIEADDADIGAHARALLQDDSQRDSPFKLVEVVTRFSMAAPSTQKDRARIVETVVTGSSTILSGPMSDFFKSPASLMNFIPYTGDQANDSQEIASQARTIIPTMAYDDAPTCLFPLTKANSMSDDQGRFWGIMDGTECAFRPAAAIPNPPTKTYSWKTAPSCVAEPTESNSVADNNGRLWGWQNNASCAFRRNSRNAARPGSSLKTAAANKTKVEPAESVSVVYEAAPSCSFSPTKANAVPDTYGRLWSWENGHSCVFRWQSLPEPLHSEV